MIFKRFLIVFPSLLLGPAPAAAEQPADPSAVAGLQMLQQLDQRLHRVGYRLTTANARYCEDTVYRSGMLLHDIAQYGDKAAAKAVHHFAAPISVNAVAGYSARKIKPGDGLVAINGQAFADLPLDAEKWAQEKPQYRRLAASNHLVEQQLRQRVHFRNNASFVNFVRDNQSMTAQISPILACASQFQIRPDDKREASADGRIVSVTSALAEYVESDDELAAIAAHELAHNLLKHRERLDALKVNRGFFGQFGKSAQRVKAAEIEADRLSVWLMANAGYDPEAAIRFWTRYGKRYGKGIFSASTHYRWKKRVKLFEEELVKMADTAAIDGKRAPPLLTSSPD